MRVEVSSRSKSQQGVSDLTLRVPIKQGLIEALDTRTYASRLRLLLRTLTAVRISSREYSAIQVLTDTVERVRAIHSFRLAILEPEQQLLLAVTFDSAWEPYIRVIWRDLGPLLDVIFCNCEGYVTAHGNDFYQYAAWIRSAQVPTEFFYADSGLTVGDFEYLRQAERFGRDHAAGAAADLGATQLVAEKRESMARRNAGANPREALQQGLMAVAGLYRLTDLYPPGTSDGQILLRAAHQLLKEVKGFGLDKLPEDVRRAFAPQLAWFESRLPEPPGREAPSTGPDPLQVQGGILTGYEASHGAVLLCSFDSQSAAREFLADALGRGEITTEEGTRRPGEPSLNIAFTFQGLRKLGVPENVLATFPQEFREGMEARCGVLGDVRGNHPRNWALPPRNSLGGAVGGRRVQMPMVDAVLQTYVKADGVDGDHEIIGKPDHPLHEKVAGICARPGLRVLSIQALRRTLDKGTNRPREHFGFLDGISQPAVGQAGRPDGWDDGVPWGELFLGYANSSGDQPTTESLLEAGTFLVMRKLRQDVAALEETVQRGQDAFGVPADTIKAKMMGRTVDGVPLSATGGGLHNAFDYSGDANGEACPFQAHIRRANPRTREKPIVPRIVRRGMSYGSRYDGDHAADERGIVFMAYNASIAEQFEVVQRWVSGGNSTNVFSNHSDPLLGLPQHGDPRTFRFQNNGAVCRLGLDGDPQRPFVRLEWGTYLFVPSLPSMRALCAAPIAMPAAWSAENGERIIQSLQALEAHGAKDVALRWKGLLEDISYRLSNTAASVWAAIRERHDGVLKTPYGVLVADDALVSEVFADAGSNYSVCGYAERMGESFGLIYLGMDAGEEYETQSKTINDAIMRVTERDAFDLALATTKAVLEAYFGAARKRAGDSSQTTWSATVEARDISDNVLAALCQQWFALPDSAGRVTGGGWFWNWDAAQPPTCPGHFAAPSRFMFQPEPGPMTSQYGRDHGRRLKEAFLEVVHDARAPGAQPLPPLARAIFDAFPPDADDLVASTFIGVLMGFLPTADGNFRSCLFEWASDRSLWDLQENFASDADADVYARAKKHLDGALRHTMQLRPVPELVWRTATKAHRIGKVDVAPKDVVVPSIVSAMQQALAAGRSDVYAVFGGNRAAATTHVHSCPGYQMAMGVLLGMVTAIMDAGPVSPGPSALSLTWNGRV